jgi:DNA adenine methylase
MRLKSAPYGRAGSKVRLSAWLTWLGSFVIHEKWGELFAGSCAVTLNKIPARWEFLNDKDLWIYNFLCVLRIEKQKKELIRRLRYSAWEKEDFERCTAIIKGLFPAPEDPVELARIFLVNNCQSFDRSGRTFSVSEIKSGLGKWKRIDEYIDFMAARIRDTTIFNLDYSDALKLKQVDDPKTLIYIDSPYVDAEKTFYAVNKQGGFDHSALRGAIEECKASFIVSYEDHPLVRNLYSETDGWIVKEMEATRSLGNSGIRATELMIVRRSVWAERQNGTMRSASGLKDMFGLEGESLM